MQFLNKIWEYNDSNKILIEFLYIYVVKHTQTHYLESNIIAVDANLIYYTKT